MLSRGSKLTSAKRRVVVSGWGIVSLLIVNLLLYEGGVSLCLKNARYHEYFFCVHGHPYVPFHSLCFSFISVFPLLPPSPLRRPFFTIWSRKERKNVKKHISKNVARLDYFEK